MPRSRLLRLGGRLAAATMFAVLTVTAPLATTAARVPLRLTDGIGAHVAHAQGGMDVGILTPAFTQLPLSVQPGQQFVIGVATAAGARCVGTLQFRDHPSIELAATPAPGGTCSWTVDVPPTVRPSTGIVTIDLSNGGQHWRLVGTLWVSVVGENRP